MYQMNELDQISDNICIVYLILILLMVQIPSIPQLGNANTLYEVSGSISAPGEPRTQKKMSLAPLSKGLTFTYKFEFAHVQLENSTYVVGYEGDLIELTLELEVIEQTDEINMVNASFTSQNPDKYHYSASFNFSLNTETGEYTVRSGAHLGMTGIFRLFGEREDQGEGKILSSRNGFDPLMGERRSYESPVVIDTMDGLQRIYTFDALGEDVLGKNQSSVYSFDYDTGLLLEIVDSPIDFFLMGTCNLSSGSGKITLINTSFDLGEPVQTAGIPFSMVYLIAGIGVFVGMFFISVKALKNARSNNRRGNKRKRSGKKRGF